MSERAGVGGAGRQSCALYMNLRFMARATVSATFSFSRREMQNLAPQSEHCAARGEAQFHAWLVIDLLIFQAAQVHG